MSKKEPRSGPAGGRHNDPKHRKGEWQVDRDDNGPDPDQDKRDRGKGPGHTRDRGKK